jgi:hypothetical protein
MRNLAWTTNEHTVAWLQVMEIERLLIGAVAIVGMVYGLRALVHYPRPSPEQKHTVALPEIEAEPGVLGLICLSAD